MMLDEAVSKVTQLLDYTFPLESSWRASERFAPYLTSEGRIQGIEQRVVFAIEAQTVIRDNGEFVFSPAAVMVELQRVGEVSGWWRYPFFLEDLETADDGALCGSFLFALVRAHERSTIPRTDG